MRTVTACVLLGCLLASAAAAAPAATRKKLIEYGWDVPAPAYVRANIRRMEDRPFDGVMMRLACGAGQVFGGKRVTEAEAAADLEALRAIEWRTFTDNFLMVYAASKMDWFSDADWETVTANTALCARAARAGRCKGVVFDAEPYGANPWNHGAQAHAKQKSFAEYQAVVRRRGAQFVQAIQKEMPDARILSFFQLSLFSGLVDQTDPAKREAALASAGYGLLPAFLNGMLDAAGPGVVFTDGNEPSYYYSSPLAFYRAYHLMRQRALALVAPENVGIYQRQMQASQALYVDYVFRYWGRPTPAEYLSPEERARWFEHNVYYALATADEYVWLYSEKMNWWKAENLPPGLEQAVVSARAKIAANRPLGFEIEEMMRQAKGREKEALAARLLRRRAEIPRVPPGRAPTVDGTLDDAQWRETQPLEAFVPYLSRGETAKPKAETRAWVAYDDANLYLGFRCAEPLPGEMRVQGETRDSNIWEGDSVDVFVGPGKESAAPYLHFILNPKNVRWDARCTGTEADTQYDGRWRSATAAHTGEWCAELAIPWSDLGIGQATPGLEFRANLCRQRIPQAEQTSWSQCAGGFVEPEHFGTWMLGR